MIVGDRMPLTCRPLPLLVLISAALSAAKPATDGGSAFFPAIPGHEIDNAHFVTEKVIAGAAPQGGAALQRRRGQGGETVISVDGATPDVETAHRFGLRYVHLPIGYDDVAPEEGKAIAKAIVELPGPIYVHCHHGKHRSAAAVAVACVLNGSLDPRHAESVLKTFGTGENYKGLWASARAARPVDRNVLDAVRVDYVERAKIPPLAEAMVHIDETMDRLKLAAKHGWGVPPEHPDIDPPHEALQLVEHFRELGRTDDVRLNRPRAFRDELARGEREAQALQDLLRSRAASGAVDGAFKALGTSCTDCHKAYRD
jgi:hypothetical protein